MKMPSLRGAIDAKSRDCGGQEGGDRFWRRRTELFRFLSVTLGAGSGRVRAQTDKGTH